MDIQQEIQALKERNGRVESEKAWEVSITRRFTISLITYIFAVIWLYTIGESAIWVKAVVPTAGYILSTISIPIVKRMWKGKN